MTLNETSFLTQCREINCGSQQTWKRTNSLNSARFTFFLDFPPNFDPCTCKLEIALKISSLQPVNDAKYENSMLIAW